MWKYLVLAALISSCSPLYVPNTRNVPLFRAKGEFQGTVYVSTGLETQLAYAVSKNIAVMANGSLISQKIAEQDYTRSHKFAEAAIG